MPDPIKPTDQHPQEPLFALLALTTAVQALATFTVFALPTLAPKAARDFDIQPQSVGYQVSLIYIAAASVSGYAGMVVRRYGACSSSLAALGLCSLGLLGLSSGHLWIMALASIITGFGYGLTNPAAAHLLLKYAPSGRRNLIFAIKQAGVPVGAMLAATLLPSLSEWIGWQRALAASALLLAMLMLPLCARRQRWDADADPSTNVKDGALAGLKLIAANPVLRALAVTGLCYAGFQVCLIAFTVTMLASDFGWSLVDAGLLAALVQIAGVVGRVGWSLIADRYGRGPAVLAFVGLLAALFGLLTSMITPAWPTSLLALVLVGFGLSIVGWNGVYMAETARISGARDVAIATGGVLIFNFAGVIVAPATFGVVAKWLGSTALTFGLFALLPLIGAVALVPIVRRSRAPVARSVN